MRDSGFLLLLTLLLVSCGGPRNYAENEAFQSDPRHRRNFQVEASSLCDAARRAMLGDGYVVTTGDDLSLYAGKEFQVEEKRHAILNLFVTCDQRPDGSTLFVTATEEHYDVNTSRKSTLVGIPLVSPISIGTSVETDSQIKIRGETVTAREFYEHFYQAVNRELNH